MGRDTVMLVLDLLPDSELTAMAVAQGEGRQCLEVHLLGAIGGEELGRDLAELEALTNELFRDAEAARDRRHRLVCVRSEEHTSELQSLMRISYAVFCLKKQKHITRTRHNDNL